jgi:hypothetical protein
MPRVRIFFAKYGSALFVPHIDLPILFSRAARRAGIAMEYTQGFSPRPRTAFGPPLPVGVEGVSEPAEFWFDEWSAGSLARWNESLPGGFEISRAHECDGASLAKLCRDASYIIEPLNGASGADAARIIEADFDGTGLLLGARADGGTALVSVTDPERSGVSRMVKALVSSSLVSGWRDIAARRTAVGRWDGTKSEVTPLSEGISL